MEVALSIIVIIIILNLIGFATRSYPFKEKYLREKLEHFLYPAAGLLYKGYEKVYKKTDLAPEENDDYYSKIYIGDDIELMRSFKKLKPVADCLLVILVSAILGIVLSIVDTNSNKLEELDRPEYGEEKVRVFTNYKDTEIPVEITINALIPSKKEMEDNVKEAIKNVPDLILKDNSSLNLIKGDLELLSYYKTKATKIRWICSDSSIIDSQGKVNRSGIYEKTEVILTMKVSCYDAEGEKDIKVTVIPESGFVSDKAYLKDKVSDYIHQQDEEETVKLPGYIGDDKVSFYTEKDNKVAGIIILGVVLGILMLVYGVSKKGELKKNREKELICDFEECVNKLILYTNCGHSISTSFEKIAESYVKKAGPKRYVYEEMIKTCNEMRNGKEMTRCLEDFGRRCENIYYVRLGAILSRQLLRGGDTFISSIEKEVTEIRREKQATIRKKGEEASIKLLIPMCSMFIIVLAVVVIPAFMNM